MTNQEAIETIKANYPDERYTMLREALDMAIKALKAQELPDVKPEKLEERTTKWLDQMTAEERLKKIALILDDWDGYRTAKGLAGLINEVWAYALYPVKAQEIPVTNIGEWTTKRTQEHEGEWYCSECGYEPVVMSDDMKYCPGCGRKMTMPEPPKEEK